MSIIGLCGLPGAGKTTAAEALSHGHNDADAYEYAYCASLTDHITRIVYGDLSEKLRACIDNLLSEYIDPDYINKWRYHCGSNAVMRGSQQLHFDADHPNTIPAHNVCEMFFSLAVKQITASLFGFSWELVLGTTAELREARETVQSVISYKHCDRLTVREALQYIGTEVFREGLYRDVWLDITLRNAQEWLGVRRVNPNALVIISDLRFGNEADAIIRAGGRIIQIYRDPKDLILTDELRSQHISVWSFLEFPDNIITARVHNNGTKADLVNAIRAHIQT